MDANKKALREALEMFCGYSVTVLNTGMFNRVHLEALLNKAKAALAEPPRQCDVGTAEEQAGRLREFCKKHRDGVRRCSRCPVERIFPKDCTLAWAQMPYEREDNDGNIQ